MKKTILIYLIIPFLLIVSVVPAVIVHENLHKWDLKGIAQNDSICYLFNCGKSYLGYYDFYYNESLYNETYIHNINLHSEVKAYALTFLIMGIFGWIGMKIELKLFDKNDNQ